MKHLEKASSDQLRVIVNVLDFYRVEEAGFYELVAISFSKISSEYTMKDRVDIIYKLTIPKIDDAVLFNKTQETLREFLSMLIHNEGLNSEGEMDVLQIEMEGLFTPKQMLYLEEHFMKNQKEVEKSQQLLQQFEQENRQKAIAHLKIQTMSFIKILF
jgi:hypothetical protein